MLIELEKLYHTADYILGNKVIPTPSILDFVGSNEACDILSEHIMAAQREVGGLHFIIHADVDMDGIASAYIMYRFICRHVSSEKVAVCINQEKKHGIEARHIGVFDNSRAKLVIIVDSSSKGEEHLKNLKCDALVIDHHNLSGEEQLTGNTLNGRYAIVNNMASKDESIADMSGAEVVYELLRKYQRDWSGNNLDILESDRLYQWVAISLFTDAIDTDNARNQWYLSKAFDTRIPIEENLFRLMQAMGKFNRQLNKSFINFSFASLINSTIRAGKGAEALDVVMLHPENINNLRVYKDMQNEILDSNPPYVEYSMFCLGDITELGIASSYCGLIAGKIMEKTGKTTVIYQRVERDGRIVAAGSFRGINQEKNYQAMINSLDGCKAEGHNTAFGISTPIEKLVDIMSAVTVGDKVEIQPLVTVGNVIGIPRGIYQYENLEELRRSGYLYRIALINSKMLSNKQINIIAPNDGNIKKVSEMGKVLVYDAYGIECKAFEEINTPNVEIYFEFRSSLEAYLRPKEVR